MRPTASADPLAIDAAGHAHDGRGEGRAATRGFLIFVAIGLVVFIGLLRVVAPERVAWVQAAIIIFSALVVQALPFVLVGALAGAVIEVFVSPARLERLSDLPKWAQLPCSALAGVAFPLCECGSVPVARRLISKGLSPSAAITFMLAAPVLNPVVIASTFVAYRGRSTLWVMVSGRFILGFIAAVTVGWVLGGTKGGESLLRRAVPTRVEPVTLGKPEARWRTFFLHLGNDFLFMGRFLLIGAAAAAMVQTFLPQSWTSRVGVLPVVDVLAMMVLALILSLCSESDAFIAASFSQFGPGPQLAFLVFGPMVDLKLISLYAGTFSRRTLLSIVVGAAAVALVGGLWVGVITG